LKEFIEFIGLIEFIGWIEFIEFIGLIEFIGFVGMIEFIGFIELIEFIEFIEFIELISLIINFPTHDLRVSQLSIFSASVFSTFRIPPSVSTFPASQLSPQSSALSPVVLPTFPLQF
jgi:hypothetical protein